MKPISIEPINVACPADGLSSALSPTPAPAPAQTLAPGHEPCNDYTCAACAESLRNDVARFVGCGVLHTDSPLWTYAARFPELSDARVRTLRRECMEGACGIDPHAADPLENNFALYRMRYEPKAVALLPERRGKDAGPGFAFLVCWAAFLTVLGCAAAFWHDWVLTIVAGTVVLLLLRWMAEAKGGAR